MTLDRKSPIFLSASLLSKKRSNLTYPGQPRKKIMNQDQFTFNFFFSSSVHATAKFNQTFMRFKLTGSEKKGEQVCWAAAA